MVIRKPASAVRAGPRWTQNFPEVLALRGRHRGPYSPTFNPGATAHQPIPAPHRRRVIVVGPPRQPHLPGLLHESLDERRLIWIQAELPTERLWVTEQLIKSNSAGAIVACLPLARQEQLRRLKVCAQSCEGLVFLCRPEFARHESSAAPLGLKASVGIDWELCLEIFKRAVPSMSENSAFHRFRVAFNPSSPRVAQAQVLFTARDSADVDVALAGISINC